MNQQTIPLCNTSGRASIVELEKGVMKRLLALAYSVYSTLEAGKDAYESCLEKRHPLPPCSSDCDGAPSITSHQTSL